MIVWQQISKIGKLVGEKIVNKLLTPKEVILGEKKLNGIPSSCTAVCAAAIRTDRWLSLYESFKKSNKTNFIFIFCGHVKPTFPLPKNFIFIHIDDGYGQSSPSLCSEITLRLARSIPEVKYVMSIADDCYYANGTIDALRQEIEKHKNEKIEIGVGFWGDISANEPQALKLKYHNHDPNSYDLTMCGMRSKETDTLIGSIDKNFLGQYWDVDRTLRLIEAGGQVKTLDYLKMCEMPPSNGSHLLGPRFYNHDRPYLDSLWTKDHSGGECLDRRSKKVEPFSSDQLIGDLYINDKP